jgi:hypothetical protein
VSAEARRKKETLHHGGGSSDCDGKQCAENPFPHTHLRKITGSMIEFYAC